MKAPRVSICLPNLNNFPYLAERVATIEAQTLTDWELVICDNHSDDGAWEFFQDLAKRDSRVQISQEPREGMYANWNNCVRKARGEFVYVATSDDTMAADCLEKMVKALDENPDCDLAHCPMKVIDQHGAPGRDWWTASSHFTKSSGDFLKQRHKRMAPFDGILCLLGDNIYSSVTQLLIRRSLFEKVGLYKADWGSLGDFHWNLRAGLAASAVHVPDTWGGWRMHPSQATANVGLNSPEHQAKIDAMIDDVLSDVERYVGKGNERGKFEDLEMRAREIRLHLREHSRLKNGVERRMFLFWGALLGKRAARQHLASLVSGGKRWPKGAPGAVSSWFEDAVLIPLA
ncbi:MAG: glycosyltransferase [Armatimonadetes bacterium]|nr:glycosyltransferase [Akkermansiaceae bacterium]